MKRLFFIMAALLMTQGCIAANMKAVSETASKQITVLQPKSNNEEALVLTEKGLEGIELGMKKSDLAPSVNGLYDAFTFEVDEMGDYGDFYQFTRNGQVVAQAYMDENGVINGIFVMKIGVRTADKNWVIGMNLAELLATDKFELTVGEGPLQLSVQGSPFLIMLDDYVADLTPQAAARVDKLYETGGSMQLTPQMVQPAAKLFGISLF